jgi:hypothetical protein
MLGDTQPQGRELLQVLSDPGEFRHAVAMLSAASALIVLGNKVELHPTRHGARSPDLRLVFGSGRYLYLEVKAPGALTTPGGSLSSRRARKVVRAKLREAARSRGGQLSPSDPGILVLAGTGLLPEAGLLLQQAAVDALRRPKEGGPFKPYLAGILLVATDFPNSAAGDNERLLRLGTDACTDLAWIPNPDFWAPDLEDVYLLFGSGQRRVVE